MTAAVWCMKKSISMKLLIEKMNEAEEERPKILPPHK